MKKTPLKAKTPLKSKSKLKAKTKLDKKPKSPRAKLKDEAWVQFSRYVRIRDTEWTPDGWYGKCITCSYNGIVVRPDGTYTKGWDAGHFVTRGHWVVRFDEENVNLQCKFHCNKMLSGNRDKYRVALRDKYGDGIPEKLEKLADDNPTYNPTKEELEQIIEDSKEAIAFYLKGNIWQKKT